MSETRRVLFTGYAPVHFLSFEPVFRRLVGDPDISLFLSGGFRTKKSEQEIDYSLAGFYEPFETGNAQIISIEQARREDFDVLICAHTSDSLFPRSVKRTVQIFHGVSFKNLAVREKALKFDLLCLPGRYHAEKYLEQGLVRRDGSQCLITGFPKVDRLVDGSLDRVSFLRENDLDPDLPCILFAPTGEKHHALETWGEKIVDPLAAQTDWNIVVKPHDHPKNEINWSDRLSALENSRFRVARDLDIIPMLNAADLLITDASSVAVEYTVLNRPIVFLDVPKLFKRVQKRAPAMDLKTYGRKIGTVVPLDADPMEHLAHALANPDRRRDIRDTMSKHVFHDPGRAAQRVEGVIRFAADLVDRLPEDVLYLRPESDIMGAAKNG